MSDLPKRIDLHMHTTHSDGMYSPRELMIHCRKRKLDCIAVTDHDTMSGLAECRAEAQKLGLELIPGIEISARFDPGSLHILGFFLDPRTPELNAALGRMQQARRERNPQIVEKLKKCGVAISMDEVIKEACGGYPLATVAGKQISRAHFARVLVKKGYVKSFREAFDRYLAKNKTAYVPKAAFSSQEAMDMIRKAGGIASLAHPKQMGLDPDELEKEVGRLVAEGLEAIEVYSSGHDPRDNEIYKKIAERYGLVVTGGSDFHGDGNSDVEVGFMGAGISLGYETVEALRMRLSCRG